MRPLLVLLLALSLGLVGCTKAPTTPTDNGNTTTSTSTGTTSTVTTTPTTNPTPPQPHEVKSGTADFSQDTPAAPLAPVAITIDPGYSLVTLNVTFSCLNAAPACVAA